MAKAILWKYNPKIVGITGSVGKTSAKEAVFIALSSAFRVRKNEKNYNNEIGIPLTIIGTESGDRSVFKWLGVFLKWLAVFIFPVNYPEILVLEMGVDRPGDMEYLLTFIRPTVGVITNISGTHLEFFKSIEQILKEKGKMVFSLPEDGLAILNADDERIFSFREKLKVPISLFGIGDDSELKASDLNFNSSNFEPQGISFKLNYEGKTIPIRLPFVLAPHLIYAVLCAISAGIFFKINIIDIARSLEQFVSPQGRMNLIRGFGGSFIIDDTYNSSPESALAGLDTIKNIKALRKIIAFGDMLELGGNSEKGHEEVLMRAFRNGVNLFYLSGDRMRKAAEKLEAEGKISVKIFFFDDPESLGKELRNILREGDLVLAKGSQGARMEKAVGEMMENPEEAKNLLCRQSKNWQKKPYLRP